VRVVSRPVIERIATSNGAVALTWSAVSGQVYRVQFKTNLDEPGWTDVWPDVTATGATASQAHPVGADALRFYRVRLVP
jgi:hypothetical protein